MNGTNDKRLFWACFVMLVATSFGFVVRTMIIKDWGHTFDLTDTEKGALLGVWLWPFSIGIVLFSLVIDRIGYARAVGFAFVCQVASALLAISAKGYWTLYLANFVGAVGNGTVEAVINPVVATMFPREKTKWLNILHAGWPGGLVVGGVLAIALDAMGWVDWKYKVALVFIPVALYGVLILGCRFPVNERVAAGVPYRDMLREAGLLGALVVLALILVEIGGVLGRAVDNDIFHMVLPWLLGAVGVALLTLYGMYARSLGRWMFFFLVIVMIPLAVTELGTDSWITSLMSGEMQRLSLNAGWVLVYTSFIMMVLRFCAGPIVHRLSPLGLLAVASAVAAIGLVSLSASAGIFILLAATLYAFGKTFFWPTMLGVVSEQFPRGGALTLNMISGIGMLGVGVLGSPFLGYIQDQRVNSLLSVQDPQVYQRVVGTEPKWSVFGSYQALDEKRVEATSASDQQEIGQVREEAQKNALRIVAILPCVMLVCYVILILYFRSRGGYKAEVLTGRGAKDERFLGGLEAAVES